VHRRSVGTSGTAIVTTRQAARLALLEQRSILADKLAELTGLESGALFPSMATTARTVSVSEARAAITEVQTNIDRLTEQAGDVEDVVDHARWLPRDRPELMLAIFSARRSVEVRELRVAVADNASSMTPQLTRTHALIFERS